MYRTADPVADAERFFSRTDPRPVIGVCPNCNKPIYGETEEYYKDDAYEIDGWTLHEDCVFPFLKMRGYKL